MGRKKNDGLGRFGGRAKGTPNHATSSMKDFIASVIDENRERIRDDLAGLEPYQRLVIIEKLMGYVIPKQQAVSFKEQLEEEYNRLQSLIDELPEYFIDRIAEKIIKINQLKSN